MLSGPKFNLPLMQQRNIFTSPALMAMPVKKKRKLDPQIVRARDERRKKRITKALKKMEKKPRIARPLLELEPSVQLVAESENRRKRVGVIVGSDVENSRALLIKEWSRFSGSRHISEIRQLDAVIISQQNALDVLREESEELYHEAIQPDTSLIPFRCFGPTRTPSIPDHFVDGNYEDITKKFSVQYADMKSFMTQLLARPNRKKKKSAEEGKDD